VNEVLVVIGVGGMGEVMARRLGAGKSVLLADFNAQLLEAAPRRSSPSISSGSPTCSTSSGQ
jgi:3-hydroxyisobutyrate dehydrogenase-like beta-hydroxyacid dehydrogenase